jgi:hypothetical protein
MIDKIYAEILANIRKPIYNGRKIVDKILTNLSIQLFHIEKCQLFTYFFYLMKETSLFTHYVNKKYNRLK